MYFRISNISARRSHAELIFCTVFKKLRSFFGAWGSRLFSVIAMLKELIFSGKRNTAIHGLDVDVTATA